jgi:signal transduction histidine kinase
VTKILTIEDEPDVREIILDILEAEGYEVAGAADGNAGVRLAEAFQPDLILCDVMMPELDGYGVLAALRQSPITATTPFVFLTARTTKGDVRQGMHLGADDYLTKPFTRDELLGAVAARLQRQSATQKQSQEQLDALRYSIAFSLPHELRTPLNGIVATSQFMLEELEDLDPEETREMLTDIHNSGQRLFRLIQNFLLYADLELAARDPQRLHELRQLQVESPAAVVETTARRQVQDWAGRSADLSVQTVDAIVGISESALQKMVIELVDNACKFSQPGQPIAVFTAIQGDRYQLVVKDSGRGMTSDQIKSVGAYQQFDRKLHEQQGSGLGLTLAQRLCTLYGGTLTITSEPEGGTTVLVDLGVQERSIS